VVGETRKLKGAAGALSDGAVTEPAITVDVVSDVACPWCYIGKRRLERAIELVPKIQVSVRWQPYRLDPTIPPEGMDRNAYIIRKFGSLEALDEAHERLTAMGRAEGVDYHFERITRSANTINAHRLVRWAAVTGAEDAMVERLFVAYFSEGLDIGSIEVLASLAGEVGLDANATAVRLTGDEDREAVAGAIEDAYRIGVTGVPCFIIDQKYAVMGAHPAESLARAITQAAGERAGAAPQPVSAN
jgi:predicted DsbA family dithiol-disulfide isomerase